MWEHWSTYTTNSASLSSRSGERALPNETDSRIIINRLLRDADWDSEDKAQVSTEEVAADGRADYVLKDSRRWP
jgi:predicted type IV restriction endonuclease